MSGDEEFEAMMAELTLQFRQSLPEHIAALHAAGAALDTDALATIAARAHRLTGLGRTFGLDEISDAAGPVELMAEAGGPLPDLREMLAKLLAVLGRHAVSGS